MSQTAETNFKFLLKRDFDIDANISGGRGLRESPIVVLDTDSVGATETQLQVLKGLGIGRSVVWRVIEKTSMSDAGRMIDRVTLETKWLENDQVKSVLENYYFDITAANSSLNYSKYIAYSDSQNNIKLPFSIGWLHFDKVVDHEPKHPGLGQGVEYNSCGIKATFYVYDRGLSQISEAPDGADVGGEFASALRDLKTANPAVESIGAITVGPAFIEGKFLVQNHYSYIGVGAVSNKYVKYRVTLFSHPFLDEIANESMQSFTSLIEMVRGNENLDGRIH